MNSETQARLNEMQAVLDSLAEQMKDSNFTYAEMQKELPKFEFAFAQYRHQAAAEIASIRAAQEAAFARSEAAFARSEAAFAKMQAHLTHVTKLVGVFGDKIYEFDDKFDGMREVLEKPAKSI